MFITFSPSITKIIIKIYQHRFDSFMNHQNCLQSVIAGNSKQRKKVSTPVKNDMNNLTMYGQFF